MYIAQVVFSVTARAIFPLGDHPQLKFGWTVTTQTTLAVVLITKIIQCLTYVKCIWTQNIAYMC